MTTPTEKIAVDIVDKTYGRPWRIIAICPERVAASGGLHVYAGRHALVVDSTTDEVLVTGRSLTDVLQNLASLTGLVVELTDETTWTTTVYTPAVKS